MTEIQRSIDDPITFLFWEVDEILLMASAMFIGIMIDMLITFGFAGIIASYILRKIKKNNSEGVVLHFLYWHGFLTLQGCPKSYIRELIE